MPSRMRHLMSGSALPIRPPHFCTFPRYGRTIFGRRGRVLERRHHGSGGGQRADHDHGDDDQHQSPAEHLHQRPENTPPVRPDGSRPRGRPAPVWGLGVREIYRTSRTNKAARALEYGHDGIASGFFPLMSLNGCLLLLLFSFLMKLFRPTRPLQSYGIVGRGLDIGLVVSAAPEGG